MNKELAKHIADHVNEEMERARESATRVFGTLDKGYAYCLADTILDAVDAYEGVEDE